MLTCLALAAAFSASSFAEIPALTAEIEAEARVLSAETQVTAALLAGIDDFSGDAARLSTLLRQAGVDQDMACVFQTIAKDARDRAAQFLAADTQVKRDVAFINLRVLMDDAQLLAPVAATIAQERAVEHDIASR